MVPSYEGIYQFLLQSYDKIDREEMDEQELDEDEVMERAESILGQQFGTDQAVNNLYESKLIYESYTKNYNILPRSSR